LSRAVVTQFVRFCLVGVGNTLVTLVVFRLLERAGTLYVAASGLAFAAGAINGYLLNRGWTFRSQGSFRHYVAVQALGLAVDVVAIAASVQDLRAPHLVAQACVLPVVSLVTFALNRRFVFSSAPSRSRSPRAPSPA
jgi:putative flippase GtrA